MDENLLLRKILWDLCPHIGKYGDDGEMQCRGLDFKRANPEDIREHLETSLAIATLGDWIK